jgi:hypothetical protein
MPRESVIAFRFVIDGALPFDPANLDDYNRAHQRLREIDHLFAPFGERRLTARVTTRRVNEKPDFSEVDAETASPTPEADPTRGEIPAALDRTRT